MFMDIIRKVDPEFFSKRQYVVPNMCGTKHTVLIKIKTKHIYENNLFVVLLLSLDLDLVYLKYT